MNDLGGSLVVDGRFGVQSQAEMERVLSALGAEPPSERGAERVIGLAQVYWRQTKFRVDLN